MPERPLVLPGSIAEGSEAWTIAFTLPPGAHHVAVVFNHGVKRVYVDGELSLTLGKEAADGEISAPEPMLLQPDEKRSCGHNPPDTSCDSCYPF